MDLSGQSSGQSRLSSRPWYLPMRGRSTDEEHRASTPLELFFDLCFVVAVSLAAGRLHHALEIGHVADGLLGYGTVFFAIWWAWVNFTWFGSAYDTDDVLYRVTTLVQIAGALILAAGVPRAFDDANFTVITIGYVVMRLAMVSQWLRVAFTEGSAAAHARRYAAGIVLVQLGWVARLALPDRWALTGFAVLAVAELLVPVVAERGSMTPWHPEHIAERYGLFTLIVLGESVLAATTAVQTGLDSGSALPHLLTVAGSGVLIVFSMWWLYFDHPTTASDMSLRTSLFWGYGHLLVFGSAAAVGVGLEVAVDHAIGTSELGPTAAALATAVPVSIYLVSVWLLTVPARGLVPISLLFPLTAILVLLAALTGAPIALIAVLLVSLVTVLVIATRTRRLIAA